MLRFIYVLYFRYGIYAYHSAQYILVLIQLEIEFLMVVVIHF